MNNPEENRCGINTLQRVTVLGLIEGALCLLALLLLPGGSGSGSFLAFTPFKLALIGAAGFLFIIFIALVRNKVWQQRFAGALTNRPGVRFSLLSAGFFLILLSILTLRSAWLLYQTTGIYQWFVLYRRLLPLLIWLILIALQTLFLIFFLSDKNHWQALTKSARQQRIILITLPLIALAFFVFVLTTRLGLVKENAFFGKPTVPLLEWHLIAGLFVCILVSLVTHTKKSAVKFTLRWLPLIIWLAAAAIWLAIPNQHGFFSPAGRAPNFEVYPFSDGSFYGHYARSLAEGMGYKGADIPPRPLYIFVLSLFHLIGGNHYDSIIVLQTLVLALLPVLLYWIGTEFYGAPAGVLAAVLYILRETNAILSAPFAHNVSTTKYFFADLPTALAGMFYILMMLRWIKSRQRFDDRSAFYAALCGGALGLMTLIRTQSLVLLLLPLLLVLTDRLPGKSTNWRQTGLFLLTLGVCLSPWLVRNQRITGRFVFDHPATQTGEMTASYNLGRLDMTREPGMNDGEYSDKLQRVLGESIRRYPKEILSFISAHFLNSEISALRVFPLRDRLAAPVELIRPAEPFWETLENGSLAGGNLLWYALYFFVVVWGISTACQGSLRIGLVSLLAFLLFNLSTAVGRYSGGRYLIPMDWVLLVYFAVGAADWIRRGMCFSGFKEPFWGDAQISGIDLARSNTLRIAFVIILFLIVGASLPLAERLLPMRFQPADQTEVLQKLELAPQEYQGTDAIMMKAIAIYPRYYAAGEGEPESAKQGYGIADYGRLIFLTLSPGNFGTIELVLNEAPPSFPDHSIVWLAGKGSGATTLADVVLIETEFGDVRYFSDAAMQESGPSQSKTPK